MLAENWVSERGMNSWINIYGMIKYDKYNIYSMIKVNSTLNFPSESHSTCNSLVDPSGIIWIKY